MTGNKTPVGFIGIGIIGAPMAGHLAQGGYPLTLCDIDRNRAVTVAARYPGVKDIGIAMGLAGEMELSLPLSSQGRSDGSGP